MSSLGRPWINRSAPTHPLVSQLAGRRAELAIGGDSEVVRIVLAAYRVEIAGGKWDPEGGSTTLDGTAVERAVELGRLLAHAGMADYEHRIPPGPVVAFNGSSLLLDLRFGDPHDDGRAVEAIARGFEELGLVLGEGAEGQLVISGGS